MFGGEFRSCGREKPSCYVGGSRLSGGERQQRWCGDESRSRAREKRSRCGGDGHSYSGPDG
jgi:hypothetical protein